MMDVSSMYGNHPHHHHHHSNNFHNAGGNETNARNAYSNAYFPVAGNPMGHVQHTQASYTQHVHALNYGSYNANSTQYYQQQHQQQQQTLLQQQQQQKQQQQHTPPMATMSSEQPVYGAHSHLFSPSAAEYGIVSSCSNGGSASANTPHHVPSHSPTESYYESDSMHSYYATAAVASVPTSTNSPTAAQSSTPNMPPIISSENGLSYTNLDCLYTQNPNQQTQLQQQQYEQYGNTLAVNCNNAEEKYANVLNANFAGTGVLVDESSLPLESSKQQAWHHHHHHHQHQHHLSSGYGGLQDASLTLDTMNMQIHGNMANMHQNTQTAQLATALCDEITANHLGSNCLATRSQQVISPDVTTNQSTAAGQTNVQSKSPSHANNLPTYKWMQLKRNVPKPQRKLKKNQQKCKI